jgi:FkbM family methyltransferase
MPPTELAIHVGASFARWRRVYGSCSPPEILQKIRRRIASRIFLWHRGALRVAFFLRNLVTRNAPITAHARGAAFQIVPESAIAFDTWSRRRFPQAELEFLLRMLRPGMTFFDVGAHAGIFSLAAGQKLSRKAGLIFAFASSSARFSILEKNLALNDLLEVRAIPSAARGQTGEHNSQQNPAHSAAKAVDCASVPAMALDEFVARAGISRVDLMNVDGEGAELLVFRGASQLLQRPDAPLLLYAAYSRRTAAFHYHPVELMWLLASFGYELFVLDAQTGRVRRRSPGEAFDAVVVAVKTAHPRYGEIAREAAA